MPSTFGAPLILRVPSHSEKRQVACYFFRFVQQKFRVEKNTPPKTKIDIQNYGLEKVTPFKYGHVWYVSFPVSKSLSFSGNLSPSPLLSSL